MGVSLALTRVKIAVVVERLPSTAKDIAAPYRATSGSAGLDWILPADVVIWPNQTLVVPSGFRIAIPAGMVGVFHARSSARKRGLSVHGVIDPDYRGEVGISIRNLSDEKLSISRGERIAQMLLQDAHLDIEINEGHVDMNTERGEKGFGSTGI